MQTPQEQPQRDKELWTTVVTKPLTPKENSAKMKATTTVGTRKPENENDNQQSQPGQLQAAERRAWLYIGKLHHNTTEEAVKRHLTNLHVTNVMECEELQSRGTLKAYKVVIPLTDVTKVNTPEAWPEGVVIRRYWLFRPQGAGARLPV